MRAISMGVNLARSMARCHLRQRVYEAEKELAAVVSLLQCLATRRNSDETISPSDGCSLEQKISPVTLAQLETY